MATIAKKANVFKLVNLNTLGERIMFVNVINYYIFIIIFKECAPNCGLCSGPLMS